MRHFTACDSTSISIFFSFRGREWFVLFFYFFTPCSVIPLISFSKPSRQMTEERMHRVGRRKVRSEWRRDGERLQRRQQHHHKQTSFSPLIRRWPISITTSRTRRSVTTGEVESAIDSHVRVSTVDFQHLRRTRL